MNRYFWALAACSAILLLAPIRKGDLAGYDDALYAQMAKGVVETGEWLDIRSNGGPALEHPPLLVWSEAAMFSVFGLADPVAKLPSALCGLGTILLVYWLALRLLGSPVQAAVAMFVMATSIYFLKYAARAMTDVLCTFLFVAAVCCWIQARDGKRWYIAVGLVCGLAQMSRGMIGLALPAMFALDLLARRRRPPVIYATIALILTFLPITAWYWHTMATNPGMFANTESAFLNKAVFGELNPHWRRYTGAPEYLWMIVKSYWPWLPAMIAGLIAVIRGRERERMLLAIWIAVVFVLCSAARSRVLRYMLPAYPAFAIVSAIGFARYVSEWRLRTGLRILVPLFGVAALGVALFPPVNLHAAEIRPIASAETAATPEGQLVAFYDEGNPRIDELNQLLWYGDRKLIMLFTAADLEMELAAPETNIFITDRAAFQEYVASRPHRVLKASGNLVCFRLL